MDIKSIQESFGVDLSDHIGVEWVIYRYNQAGPNVNSYTPIGEGQSGKVLLITLISVGNIELTQDEMQSVIVSIKRSNKPRYMSIDMQNIDTWKEVVSWLTTNDTTFEQELTKRVPEGPDSIETSSGRATLPLDVLDGDD